MNAASPPRAADGVAALLSRFSTYEAEERREEQLFFDTPAGRLFATLVEPLGSRRRAAFLTCHSFAWEQYELYPFELTFARLAARAGFPVLTYQARGYGDSGGEFSSVTPGTQMRDGLAAAKFLADRVSLERIVPVGVRFGTLVALRVATRTASPGVVLWDPVVEPARFLERLLRTFSVTRVIDEEGEQEALPKEQRPTVATMHDELSRGNSVDLFGYPLSSACFEESARTRVLDGLGSLPRPALVLSINPAARRECERVAKSLGGLGAHVLQERVDQRGGVEFGVGIPRGGHLAKHQELIDAVAGATVAWAEEVL